MLVSELPHGLAFWLHLRVCSNATFLEESSLTTFSK